MMGLKQFYPHMLTYTYWKGSFLKKYKYFIYALPATFGPEQIGNFIFARIEKGVWVPIFIGEGDLHMEANFSSASTCALFKGATHIHVHLNNNQDAREAEIKTLLAKYPMAFEPVGCNKSK